MLATASPVASKIAWIKSLKNAAEAEAVGTSETGVSTATTTSPLATGDGTVSPPEERE